MDRMIFPAVVFFVATVWPVCGHAESAWSPVVAEASLRFNIPEEWIRTVIATESNGKVKAVSPKGAMGLMQLMPRTWKDMRKAHNLGADPFDPHANILAGTAYLRAMYDRFGYPALFAAYNAGPERYAAFLNTGKLLPNETRLYTARIEKSLAVAPQNSPAAAPENPHPLLAGTGLFYPLSSAEPPSPGGIFVRLSMQETAPR